MKISGQWLSGAIVVVVAAVLLSSARPASADGYTIFNLGNDNGHGIYGMDTAGDVVIWGTSGCGGGSPYCYVTYANGVAISDSSTAPDLVYDDGTPCGSAPAGFNASKKVCNNGWIGLGSVYSPNGNPNGVYVGSGSDMQFLQGGSADQVFLNSLGDFAWTDGQSEAMFVAIANATATSDIESAFIQDFDPVTTPEPTSLLLVGSGLFLFLAAVLRKAAGQPSSYIE